MAHEVTCSLGYHQYESGTFNNFAGGVQTGIADNPDTFDQKVAPVNNAVLAALMVTLLYDFSNYQKGGIAQKQTYLTSKEHVMEALDKLVPWINKTANGDSKIIILAGYEATYSLPAHKSMEEEAPLKITVKNGQTSGTLLVECETYGVSHSYGCLLSEGKALDSSISIGSAGQIKFPAGSTNVIYQDLNHNRMKKFMGLTPGINYWIYFYVISTAGVTSFSLAVIKMAI